MSDQVKCKITSHILDLSRGKPASGVEASLYQKDSSSQEWKLIGKDVSNQDGRLTQLLEIYYPLQSGVYKIVFESGSYYKKQNLETFYPQIGILFNIDDSKQHYHVPLLLNQFGFSTYRGS